MSAGTAILSARGRGADPNEPRLDRPVLSGLIVVLLVLSLLSWRTGDYYSGGFDAVVVAKAMLGLIALVLSWFVMTSAPSRNWIGGRTVGLCLAYLATALIGGMASGGLFSNVVLVIRVLMVLCTMMCLAMAVPLAELIDRVCDALAGVGLVLGLTALPTMSHTGRLSGGLLPINPNQMALLFGMAILSILWRMLNDRRRRFDPIAFFVLLALTWLTGSRTGLVALVIAIATIMVLAPRLPLPAALTLVLAVPGVFYLLYLSPIVSSYFNRGGTQNITTLNSRTIAWSSVLSTPVGFWRRWFGGGLGVKEVAVSGTYWNAQVIDSSWLSALVQVGVIGLALMTVWVLLSLGAAARAPRPYRAFLLAAVLYAIINSLLVTGLLDAYVLFILILLPAFGSEVLGVQRRLIPVLASAA